MAAIGLVAGGLAGCVIIPTATTPVNDIPSEQREALKGGVSTRVDVLMRYGNPELRLEGDRILVYQWERIRAIAVTIAVTGGPLLDLEALFLEFDDRGVLLRTGTAIAWNRKSIAEQAQEWARSPPSAP